MEMTIDEIAAELSISKKQVRRRFTPPYTRADVDKVLADPPPWLQRRQTRLAELAARVDVICAKCAAGSAVEPQVADQAVGFICRHHLDRGDPLPPSMTPPRGKRRQIIQRTGSNSLAAWCFVDVERPGQVVFRAVEHT